MFPEERHFIQRPECTTRPHAPFLLTAVLSLSLGTAGLFAQDSDPESDASPPAAQAEESGTVSTVDTVRVDARKAMSEAKWEQAVAE